MRVSRILGVRDPRSGGVRRVGLFVLGRVDRILGVRDPRGGGVRRVGLFVLGRVESA